jgi:hypothetical protein
LASVLTNAPSIAISSKAVTAAAFATSEFGVMALVVELDESRIDAMKMKLGLMWGGGT